MKITDIQTTIKMALISLLFFGQIEIVHATIIHETASLGTTNLTSGSSISLNQFIGTPFSIIAPVQITKIGGHMVTSTGNTIFGAIVPVPSPGSIPAVAPLEIEIIALAFTTFNAGFPSNDVRVPLSILLPAGDYALIFGTGLFGASGGGAMINSGDSGAIPVPGESAFTTDNINVPGYPNGRWNTGFSPTGWRMVVEGDVVQLPEPSMFILFAYGMIGIGITLLLRRTRYG